MPIVKLTPSNWSRSVSYIQVTDASNMYDDASDTSNYATIRGRGGQSTNSTYSLFVYGWDFSQIPYNASVNSFTIRIRCSCNSFLTVGSSYRLRLCSTNNNSGAISGTNAMMDITSTPAVIPIPTGSLTWADISGYGSTFSIQFRIRNTSHNASDYPYIYIYGAEIEVDYDIPIDTNSNYYITTGYGGWSPCIQGNTQYGLQPFPGSVLPNCSGFATGRFNELLSLGACTYLGNANGGDFMQFAYQQNLGTGVDPVVGAAIVWGDPGLDGHVAIVEQVIDIDNIVTSESGWNYTSLPIVRSVTRNRGGNGAWGYSQAFKGFIYPPGVPGSGDEAIIPFIYAFIRDEED